MASIGLGLMQGAMLADQAKRQNEETYRLRAGRALWDAQLKETEEATKLLGEMNDKARTAKKSVLNNQERVLNGDPTGTANVLNDTMLKGTGNVATVDPSTKEVVIKNSEGKEVGRQQPLAGMQGVASLMQLGQTVEQVAATDTAAKQLLEQRKFEMTKLVTGKEMDYKSAIDKQILSNQGLIGSASLAANAKIAAANIGANSALAVQGVRSDADLRLGHMQYQDKFFNTAVGAAVQDTMGITPERDDKGNFTIPMGATPEQRAAIATKANQVFYETAYGGPKTTPGGAVYGAFGIGRTDYNQDINNSFNLGVSNLSGSIPASNQFINNLGLDSIQPTTLNNYGFNYGTQGTVGLMQNNLNTQQQAMQAADQAQANRMKQAARYGFVR